MISGPNWARRYGQGQRRLCARPGCGAPAAATLRFQPTQREAWLVDLEDDAARTEGDLCARHAAGLVLPRGWNLHKDLAAERGEAVPPRAPVRRTRDASVQRARRRRAAPSAVQLPGLTAVTEAAPPPTVDAAPTAPAPAVAAPVTPETEPETEPGAEPATGPEAAAARETVPLVAPATPEASEALAETLDAQTPLLRRAFQNVPRPDNNS